MPMTPRSKSRSMRDRGIFACSSISRTSGRICASANSRTLSRKMISSSASRVSGEACSAASWVTVAPPDTPPAIPARRARSGNRDAVLNGQCYHWPSAQTERVPRLRPGRGSLKVMRIRARVLFPLLVAGIVGAVGAPAGLRLTADAQAGFSPRRRSAGATAAPASDARARGAHARHSAAAARYPAAPAAAHPHRDQLRPRRRVRQRQGRAAGAGSDAGRLHPR